MSKLHVSIPHQLSQDEALKRIQQAITQAKTQNPDKVRDLQESWNGYEVTFSGKAMGHAATGTLSVNPSEVTVETTLPLFASPFKSTIEAKLRDVLTRILA